MKTKELNEKEKKVHNNIRLSLFKPCLGVGHNIQTIVIITFACIRSTFVCKWPVDDTRCRRHLMASDVKLEMPCFGLMPSTPKFTLH